MINTIYNILTVGSVFIAYIGLCLTYKTFVNTKNIEHKVSIAKDKVLLLQEKDRFIDSLDNFISIVTKNSEITEWSNEFYAITHEIETKYGTLLKLSKNEYSSYFKNTELNSKHSIKIFNNIKSVIIKECL